MYRSACKHLATSERGQVCCGVCLPNWCWLPLSFLQGWVPSVLPQDCVSAGDSLLPITKAPILPVSLLLPWLVFPISFHLGHCSSRLLTSLPSSLGLLHSNLISRCSLQEAPQCLCLQDSYWITSANSLIISLISLLILLFLHWQIYCFPLPLEVGAPFSLVRAEGVREIL